VGNIKGIIDFLSSQGISFFLYFLFIFLFYYYFTEDDHNSETTLTYGITNITQYSNVSTLEKFIYYLSGLECGNIMKDSSKFEDKRKSLIGWDISE